MTISVRMPKPRYPYCTKTGKPKAITNIVISHQTADVPLERIRKDMIDVTRDLLEPTGLLNKETTYFVNPTGKFVIGGPHGDAGLTGRKIIVDTYGGVGCHGGGAFSGKDPSKVDRSAAYYARYAAKNIVAAGLAEKCEIQVAYAIGVAKPLSINIDTFGTGTVDEVDIQKRAGRWGRFRFQACLHRKGLEINRTRKIGATGKPQWQDTSVAISFHGNRQTKPPRYRTPLMFERRQVA